LLLCFFDLIVLILFFYFIFIFIFIYFISFLSFLSCGDFTSFGREGHVEDFNDWLGTLKYKYKTVVVAGNHENNLKNLPKRLSNAIFLDQSEVIVCGYKIYGTKFFWKSPGGNPYYDMIPNDTNILITHQPPEHYFDGAYGCPTLLKRVQQIKPKLHLFGHIHMQGRKRGFGTKEDNLEGTEFINAAMCAEKDKICEDGVMIVELDGDVMNGKNEENGNIHKTNEKNEE
jgi:Icc-related predicted phosphoesterase